MLFQSSVYPADAIVKGGSAAAPTAGTAFVTLGSIPPAGKYLVTVAYTITGATETAALNVRLTANGVSVIDMPSNFNSVTNASLIEVPPFQITMDGTSAAPKLTAVASATASTVYAGVLIFQRIG